MKYIATILLLSLSSFSAFAESKHKVEGNSNWIIVSTYNETSGSDGSRNDFPDIWMIKRDMVTSIDLAASQAIVSRDDRSKQVGRIVKIRITTSEQVKTKTGFESKEYVSGWMDIKSAEKLMRNILELVKIK